MPSRLVWQIAAKRRYEFEFGFGDLNSKRVASLFFMSLINAIKIVLFLDGLLGECPKDETMQTGASKPGFSLLRLSFVEETNGLMIS